MFHQKYYRQNGQPYAQRERKTYILYIYISNYTLLTLSALRVGDWGEGGGGGGGELQARYDKNKITGSFFFHKTALQRRRRLLGIVKMKIRI